MTDYSIIEDEIMYVTNTTKKVNHFHVGKQVFHIPPHLGLVSQYISSAISIDDLIRNPKYYEFITAETLIHHLTNALAELLKSKWLLDSNGVTDNTYFEVCNFLFNVIEYCNRTPDAEVGCK